MTRSEPIAVFAYAFAHKKTQDFLIELAAAGFRKVTVIGAPWKSLPYTDTQRYFPKMLRHASALGTAEVCRSLGFEFHECEHDDVSTIASLQQKAGFTLGIISGARMIKKAVIELFEEGILNLHPGKIPETSGLDLFYYTIKHDVPLGITAHYIDHRVDAGMFLFFEETTIGPEDTPEAVNENNYQSQIRALRRFIECRDIGSLSTTPVIRPQKNIPMTPEEKRLMIERFPIWRAKQVAQKIEAAKASQFSSMIIESESDA